MSGCHLRRVGPESGEHPKLRGSSGAGRSNNCKTISKTAMTHSSFDPESYFEEWLLEYDSMLVDDLSATLPSGSRVDPGRDPELHK